MIRLYDYVLSGSCYKVRLFLSLLGLAHDTVPMDYHPGRAHRKPDFLELNPLGRLPVLEDGDLALRDAQAILVYLAAKYDGPRTWYPADPENQGVIAMWLFFAGGELMHSSAARLHDMLGHDFDVDRARAGAHAALRVLDDHLNEREFEGKDWIATDHPTIADVACFPGVALSGDGGIRHDDYHAIRRWLDRVKRLPRFIDMPGIHRAAPAGG